ncbi:hypothetical protein HK101_010142, partial [Irineochytrium annulatum]
MTMVGMPTPEVSENDVLLGKVFNVNPSHEAASALAGRDPALTLIDVMAADEAEALLLRAIHQRPSEQLQEALDAILSRRYLSPRNGVVRSPALHEWRLSLDERRFKQELRMKPASFHQLVDLIEGHPVFHNNSFRPQAPVDVQLTVLLKRFGCYGNGASVGAVARECQIAEGTMYLYMRRCMKAILSLEAANLRWPQGTERTRVSDEIFLGRDPEKARSNLQRH